MRILFTGGKGTLGNSIVPLLSKSHQVWQPTRDELDIVNPLDWQRAFDIFQPDTVVHAAAFTSVEKAETERAFTWLVNVQGTKNGLALAKLNHIRFVFIGTDYVFDGMQAEDSGGYNVDDPLGPVNYYGFTKTAAELMVREYDQGAVIRTSFVGNKIWKYTKAFTDLWTGKDYLSVLAPDLAMAVEVPFVGVVHICTERKTVYELACRTRPDVEPVSRMDAPIPLPRDVSLNTASWEFNKKCWSHLFRSRS